MVEYENNVMLEGRSLRGRRGDFKRDFYIFSDNVNTPRNCPLIVPGSFSGAVYEHKYACPDPSQ
jgi:hypothetical protein